MKSIRTIVAGMLFILYGCIPELGPLEYVKWVENYENNLHVQKRKGEYVFDLQYKPTEYVALQQNGSITESDLARVLLESAQVQYFTLTIGLENSADDFLNYGISNIQEKQQKIYYYAYQFQQDIYLVEGGEKLPCVLFHFERSADMKNSRTFVLAFESHSKVSDDAVLVINSPLLGDASIEIQVSKDKIPTLKL